MEMDTGYTQVEGTVKNDLFLSGQFITRTKAIMNTFLLVYQGLLLLLVFFYSNKCFIGILLVIGIPIGSQLFRQLLNLLKKIICIKLSIFLLLFN